MDRLPEIRKDIKLQTDEELEARVTAIDIEIMNLGENITPNQFKKLAEEKGEITMELANRKGEPIDKRKIGEY